MLVGLDSTDSLGGGCTTYVAAQALARLEGLAVRAAPRLVRLNPNVPFKTRGNGALAFELGHPVGPTQVVGVIGGREVHGCDELRPLSRLERLAAFDVVRRTVDELRAPDADSGLVAYEGPPPPETYWRAVQRLVPSDERRPAPLEAAWGNGRGLLGATAAAAWPAQRGTWEAIGYRAKPSIGTPRSLRPTLGAEIDGRFPQTFDNWDPVHEHLRLAPASPCPVLAGVRATDPQSAIDALGLLGPENPESWMLFWTNQATGDHLRRCEIAEIAAYDGIRVVATVREAPLTRPGGHVFLPVMDATGAATAVAYEPTKEFRDAIRRLEPGDEIEIEASAHEDPRLLALEAVALRRPSSRSLIQPPRCPTCDRSMKSRGRRAGYRCETCRTRSTHPAPRHASESRATFESRITVPVAVRRHLTRPPRLDESRLARRPPLQVLP